MAIFRQFILGNYTYRHQRYALERQSESLHYNFVKELSHIGVKIANGMETSAIVQVHKTKFDKKSYLQTTISRKLEIQHQGSAFENHTWSLDWIHGKKIRLTAEKIANIKETSAIVGPLKR